MKQTRVFLLPPGWDARPLQGYPPALNNHLYPAIMDKSSWETPWKRPVLLNTRVFPSPIFKFRCPLALSNVVTTRVSTKRISTLKRGRGGLSYPQKRRFLKLRKDVDRKHLFCTNVSTLKFVLDCGWREALWELSVLPKNTTSPAKARTQTARSRDKLTNHEATAKIC